MMEEGGKEPLQEPLDGGWQHHHLCDASLEFLRKFGSVKLSKELMWGRCLFIVTPAEKVFPSIRLFTASETREKLFQSHLQNHKTFFIINHSRSAPRSLHTIPSDRNCKKVKQKLWHEALRRFDVWLLKIYSLITCSRQDREWIFRIVLSFKIHSQ